MIIIYTIVDKNSFKEMSDPHSQKNTLKCSTWVQSQKRQNDLVSKAKFNITIIQVHAPITNVKEGKVEQIYEDLEDLLEQTPKTDVLFIRGRCRKVKVGSQEVPGVTARLTLEYKVKQDKAKQTSAKRAHWS